MVPKATLCVFGGRVPAQASLEDNRTGNRLLMNYVLCCFGAATRFWVQESGNQGLSTLQLGA